MNLEHAHKTRFRCLLGVFSKFSDEHPCHFYRGVLPPQGNSFSLLLAAAKFCGFAVGSRFLSLPELAKAKILLMHRKALVSLRIVLI